MSVGQWVAPQRAPAEVKPDPMLEDAPAVDKRSSQPDRIQADGAPTRNSEQSC